MHSNTHSDQRPAGQGVGRPDRVASLVAAMDELAAEDVDGLAESALAEELQELQRVQNRLDGQWLRRLAALDAQGAAGAEQGERAASTAAWLRRRLRMSASAASGTVRAARALFRGPLTRTAEALVAGELSVAHARVLADGTHDLAPRVAAEAEPVLVELAGRLDPPHLRRAVAQLCQVADPEGADRQAARHLERRGLWLSPTWAGMVAVGGLLEPEAGATVLAALEPLARPAGADDARTGSQRTADALTELARRSLEGGWLPKAGGVRPQLLVTVELETLLGRPGAVGGDLGWVGPLDAEGCRRLACDGAVTRVLVSRRPGDGGPGERPVPGQPGSISQEPVAAQGLQASLRAAMALLPPTLGGAPCQPLEVGRATRVVAPAQRAALAVRDGGCVFPGCDRPLAWCDAHHLWHWVDGGPTDLANLALLCRAHHREVHEGGWRLIRGPDGRFTASRSPRRPRAA